MINTVNTSHSLSDEQLLEQIAHGRNKEALAELYDKYRHSLGSYIRRKVYEDRLVDEIYNDVMLTIWQKADSFRGDSTVSTWIFAVANRVCMAHSRKEKKHTQQATEAEFDEMPSPNSSAESDSELKDQLRIATAKLNESHRTVIELAYFHGYNLNEIAEIVDCPVNTVKTRLFHARQNLKINIERQAAQI